MSSTTLLRFFIIFIFVISINGQSEIYSSPEHIKNNIYFLVQEEGGKWFYSKLKIPKNEYQENLETLYFDTLEELKNYLFSNYSQLQKVEENFSYIEIPNSSRNLKIWNHTQNWSMDWEQKYSNWIQREVDEYFFQKYNIATDCADIVVALRWIFARIHSLPMAFSLAGSGVLFTNESFRNNWRNLKTNVNWFEDELFLTSLNYILSNTFTHSLWKDSFPVHISKDTFLPGSYHIILRGTSGHTLLYIKNQTENIKLIYSDVPRSVRRLYSSGFNEKRPELNTSGFLNYRWPIKIQNKWRLTRIEEMPNYSLNQYSDEFTNNVMDSFSFGFLNALGLSVSPTNYFYGLLVSLHQNFLDRIAIVSEGFEYCKLNDCSPNTQNYFFHSTHARDDKILKRFLNAEKAYLELGPSQPAIISDWRRFLLWGIRIEGQTLLMKDLLEIWKSQSYSADPQDSILKRWGMDNDI